MKVLVFGGRGWLGGKLAQWFNTSAPEVDILDIDAVAEALEDHKPEVVINAAGKTGRPNIDWCAASAQNRALTRHSNDYGVAVLRTALDAIPFRRRPKLVHLSSGCLWETGAQCTEETVPMPASWYSATKAMGEQRLRGTDALVLRIRMPFDGGGSPRCLLTKLMLYDTVLDCPNSLTYVPDFLIAVSHLIDKDKTGIWNIANPGTITHPEILDLLREVFPDKRYEVVTPEVLRKRGLVKETRSNVTLSVDKLREEAGMQFPTVSKRLRLAIQDLAALVGDPRLPEKDRKEAR